MPHLTLQVAQGGALIDLSVGVSAARAQALQQAGQLVPNPVVIRGLIDTGASCTCVDPSIPRALGLVPRGVTPILTPSTGAQAHQANLYDVSLTLLHPKLSLSIANVPVAESQLAVQGILALIGRDILANCLFLYDGQAGLFTLAF